MDIKKWLRWSLILLVVAIGAYLFWAYDLRAQFSQWFQEDMKIWLENHPVLAPFAYFLVYVAAVIGFMPGSVITLVGGALFGPILGLIYVSLASTTAAAIAFLIARYLAADWVERKASGRLETVKEGIDKQGWRFGLTGIKFWTYVWVSWVAMLPGTFAYVYLGFAGQKVAVGGVGLKKLIAIVGTAIGLIILVSMIPKWVKQWQEDEIEEIVADEETLE